MGPPFLWERFEPGQGDGIAVSLNAPSSTVTVAPHGIWGRRLRRATDCAVEKCLAERPSALLIDTAHLVDSGGDSAATWVRADRAADAIEPPVRVLLHVPGDTGLAVRLHRTGALRSLHVFPSLAATRDAAARRLTGRFDLGLSPDPAAAATARAVVSEACEAWRLPDLVDRCRLIVSELVTNAVEHARPPITVVISRRGNGVHLAVCDNDPRLPQMSAVVQFARRGSGLHAVHAAATLWGAMPSGAGKAVWATIMPWRRR
ncbi:ATP-binding protein [Paractinoplanes lichenicola]|uniref:ATP-binding protein n=1 Tax=Paractinoplanes lichenicola TaxID=2802976 RepID=A0ABS1W4U1_9ACTN|nr:ATP-binding protein [Actinoplanes lichenicola]MBL7261573.1 ATP-binding protein [Actinoplanes lichenicola]